MKPSVNFSLQIGAHLLDEHTLARDLPAYLAAVHENVHHEGTLTPDLPTAIVVLEDDLHATVPNFCLLPIPKLLSGQPATYTFLGYAGQLRIKQRGNDVEFSGGHIEEVITPLAPFLRKAIAYTDRFIQLLRDLHSNTHRGALRHLEDQLAAATSTILRPNSQVHEAKAPPPVSSTGSSGVPSHQAAPVCEWTSAEKARSNTCTPYVETHR
jgi:hypothetical protein